MTFYAYVLKSDVNNRLYYGHTKDLEQRIKEHNSGKTKSTKAFIPYVLVFYEICATRDEAIKRERFFKSGSGREYVREKIKLHS